FHSLTGMAFAVERLLRTPELDPKQTRNSLRQIVVGLQDAQRTLRLLIEDLRAADRDVSDLSLDTEIEQVATRIERQWNVKVALTVIDGAGIPARQWADVCLIVQEALTNAARHAKACSCTVEVGVRSGWASITITDDGQGFPVKGSYDHDALTKLRIGPRTLM